jgi:hypothetical protein
MNKTYNELENLRIALCFDFGQRAANILHQTLVENHNVLKKTLINFSSRYIYNPENLQLEIIYNVGVGSSQIQSSSTCSHIDLKHLIESGYIENYLEKIIKDLINKVLKENFKQEV